MQAKVRSVAFQGIDVLPVDVQVLVAPGQLAFVMVGLADKAVGESRERVRGTFRALGLSLPPQRITVNLSPADLAKEGSHYDLPIALGLLAAMGVVGGVPVVGLPGNPVAAVVTFLHLARPLALRLAGALPEPLPRFPARAGFAYRKKAGRREYVRVRLGPGAPLPEAAKFEREGAGLLSSLTECDAFAELPEEITAVAPGDTVRVLPFAAMF